VNLYTLVAKIKQQAESVGSFELPPIDTSNHDGALGHHVESWLGLTHNASCTPDFMGIELKTVKYKTTKKLPKVTFGDWQASWYLFDSHTIPSDVLKGTYGATVPCPYTPMSRETFLRCFGAACSRKPQHFGRYAWSGRAFPKLGSYNHLGQRLCFYSCGTLIAEYDPRYDTRAVDERPSVLTDLMSRMPQKTPLMTAFWEAGVLSKKVNAKFNQVGSVTIHIQKPKLVLRSVTLHRPISWEMFSEAFREGKIILDSGMNEGTSRNRSQFRSVDGTFFQSLVWFTEEFNHC
jgi:hypothetical protein